MTVRVRQGGQWKVVSGSTVSSLEVNVVSSAYTLSNSDIGKLIKVNNSSSITVPASTFVAGQNVTIYNNSTSSLTIVQGTSVILRVSETSDIGDYTLEQRGLINILCVANNEFVIESGAGGGGGGTTKVAILSDVKSSGTAGGTFTSGSWIDRTLNTEVDPESFVTFSSSNDYFALESGTYKINWSAPAYNTSEHKTQLVYANNTSFTSPTNIQGTSEFDSSGIEPNTQTRSFGETVVTITETTYFKLQHRCIATQNSNGLGIESNFGVNEVYSQIVVQDLSSGGGSGGGSGSSGGSLVKHGTVIIPTNPLSLTEAAFTNIPSTAKKITVSLYRFSYNTLDGTSDNIIMEVGDSSGYANSGYQSAFDSVDVSGNLGGNQLTTAYGLADDTSIPYDYNITIELVNVTGNSWTISHQGGDSTDKSIHGGGSITLSNALDKLRIKTQNGRYLDNGIVTVHYETEGSGGSSGSSGGSSLVKLGTVDATSSTAAAFTNIPSTAKKITVSIHRANFNGTSNIGFLSMEVGDSSGYIQSGYESSYELRDQASDAARTQNFYGLGYSVNDTDDYSYNIELVNITGNKWNISHVGHSNQSTGQISHGAGSIELTSALDKLRIQTYSGGTAQTFDSGEVTVYYETEGSGSGSSGGSSNNQTWLADYQNVQSETGSNVEWTGIPEDTQRIIIMFYDVSPGSTQDWLVQLGNTSGNYSAGVYQSASTTQTGTDRYDADGFIINVTSDSVNCSGRMVIERNRQDNTRGWVATGQITHGTGGAMRQFAGSFASSTTISVFDRIRFTSEDGTSRCFDSGRISILCEGPNGGSGSSSGGFVTGMIMMFSGTTAPTGWVLCDNSAEAQAANAPDLRDRFIVGTGNSYNLNATGGSANATLPTHTHYAVSDTSVSSGGGTPGTAQDLSSSNYIAETWSTNNGGTQYELKGTSSAANVAKTSSAGSSSTNANLPPYYALAFIMKT